MVPDQGRINMMEVATSHGLMNLYGGDMNTNIGTNCNHWVNEELINEMNGVEVATSQGIINLYGGDMNANKITKLNLYVNELSVSEQRCYSMVRSYDYK